MRERDRESLREIEYNKGDNCRHGGFYLIGDFLENSNVLAGLEKPINELILIRAWAQQSSSLSTAKGS